MGLERRARRVISANARNIVGTSREMEGQRRLRRAKEKLNLRRPRMDAAGWRLSSGLFPAFHTFRHFHPSKRHMMTPETLYRLAAPLICLQFFALGWRVNREINAPNTERQPVIPLPDVINIMSLFTTVSCLVVLP